jgi:hypothetical protein
MLGITIANKFIELEKIHIVMELSGAILGVFASILLVTGGYLYDVSKAAPFYILLGMSGLLEIVILILNLKKR